MNSKPRESFGQRVKRLAGQRRGVAILLVIAVLAGLVALAAPFVMSMALHGRQARNDLTSLQARTGAEAAIAHATAQLYKTTLRVDNGNTTTDPLVTTPADLKVSMDFPAAAVQLEKLGVNVSNTGGLMWSAKVEDEQGKINVSSAHPVVLGNLMGSALLTDDAPKGANVLTVDDASQFRPTGGTISLNGEPYVLKYSSAKGTSIVLQGGLDKAHVAGAVVYDGRARLIADYKWRGDGGQYQPLKSIYELKAALQGGDFIGPDEFARIERHITVQSGLGGPLWGHGQIPPQPAGGQVINSFVVEKGDGFTPGGLIRMVQNGKVEGFRRLDRVNLRGDGSAALAWEQEYSAPQRKSSSDILLVQPEFQHPININTASTEVLEAVFTGLCMFGSKDAITREKAQLLVDHMRERGTTYATKDQLKKAFDEAHNRGLLSGAQRDAAYINAVEPNSPKLRTSTVPFVFHSFGHFTIEGSGVVNSDNGVQLSRNIQRQMLSLPTPWPGLFKIQYQRQFQELLDKGLGSRVVTFPEPMGAQRFKRNVSSVRLGRDDTGGVRLDVGESGSMGFNGEWLEHCSDPNDGGFRQDGYDMSKRGPFDIDKDTPSVGGSSAQQQGRPIVATLRNPNQNNNNRRSNSSIGSVATQPAAVDMWYKPLGGGQCVFYDEGLEEDRNRITFSYKPGEGLKVEVCDAGYECQGTKTSFNHMQRNPLQYIFPVELTPGDWHHVAASWKAGCYNGIEIRYDAQFIPPRGDPIIQKPSTKLARSLGLTDDTVSLEEAPDEDFPLRGAVRIGEEIIEYQLKQGNTLVQCKRGARMSAISKHDDGEAVIPHGYSVPIAEDWYVGGAKLVDRVPSLTEISSCKVDVPKPPPNNFVVHTETKEIPVSDASAFPTSGFVIIRGELLYYGKRSATKLQDLQRAMSTAGASAPARNFNNGALVHLVSIEITNSNDYLDRGIVQLDDENNDKQVEWLHYTSKQIMNGKHYLLANIYNTTAGGIQQGNPQVNVPLQPNLNYEQHGDPNRPDGSPADFQFSWRGCFNIGFRQAHGKKTSVIPVMRVTRPDCGDRDSAFGERGVSEVSVVERGSTSGDLMYIKQAATYQRGQPRYNARREPIDLDDWDIQHYVGLHDFLSRRYPQGQTRVLKWPSGELPDAVGARRMIGASNSGEGQMRGHVDEIRFNNLTTETARIAMTTKAEGVSADADSILLEPRIAFPQDRPGWPPRGNRDGLPTLNWPTEGLIRIEEELIYYESFRSGEPFTYFSDLWPRLNQAQRATESKEERIYTPSRVIGPLVRPNECSAQGARITRLKRGVLGTDAKDHPVGATVMLIDGVPISPLVSMSRDSLTVKNGAGFPREGYVWINKEVISYLDGGGKAGTGSGAGSATLTGIQNFRGRYGTREDSHEPGDLAIALPFRYWDRNPQYTECDGIAFVQGGYFAQDAIWDSIELETKGTEEYPKPNAVRPRVFARFDSQPSWSAEPSNVEGGLWEFRNKDGIIPLRTEAGRGVRADEAELRVYWEYKPGAFIPNMDWKRTFQIEKMRVNYRTPLIIRRLDELERR